VPKATSHFYDHSGRSKHDVVTPSSIDHVQLHAVSEASAVELSAQRHFWGCVLLALTLHSIASRWTWRATTDRHIAENR
jgi:hypothetical protein